MGAIVILAITFGLMYALFILPQKRRMNAQRQLLRAIDVGDEVMLTSGFYGTVVEVDEGEDVIWLELADGLEVKVARGAVSRRVTAGTGDHEHDHGDHEHEHEDDDEDGDDVGDTDVDLTAEPRDPGNPDR
jgi:preprotein translocase subunit YajC